tara:strand:- start:727 stop:1008 length:282 start_codon:yes stop_codon:yes gene_type:complete
VVDEEKNVENLLFFYGTECGKCHEMDPLIEQLEKEEGVVVERFEIWHDDKNMAIFKKYDEGKCGGIPFLYNKKSGKWICGKADYAKLKEWALG